MKNTRRKRRWQVVDTGFDTRIMECRPSKENKEHLVTYSEAKAEALQQLEEFVSPYLKRIDELRRDEFEEVGKLPKYKAWVKHGMIVVARSQERAAERLHSNTYDIRNYYRPAHGDWWYRYAAEESVWIEVKDERRRGTGEYIKMLSDEEARAILQEELAKYETMPLARLARMIEHEDVIERACSEGSVRVMIKVCRYDWEPSFIRVDAEIEERVLYGAREHIKREIEAEQSVCRWQEVGF